MQAVLTYLSQNKEWLFSGVGVTALTCVFLVVRKFVFSPRSRSAAKTPEQGSAPFTTHLNRPNRVTFANGTIGAVEAGFAYRVVDPVLYTYEADKPLDILISIADSRCRQTLERHSISDARTQREDLERLLVDSLQPDFATYGLQIDSFYIGSIRDVARPTAHKANGASPESERKKPRPRYRISDGSIPLTPLSYSLRFDAQKPGGALTLADGTTARMDLEVVCRIVNPYLAVFGTTDAHFMDTLAPVIYSRVHQLVEAHSLPSARAARKQTEALLRTELEPEFKKFGVTIEGLFIGALESAPTVAEGVQDERSGT